MYVSVIIVNVPTFVSVDHFATSNPLNKFKLFTRFTYNCIRSDKIFLQVLARS